MKQAVFILLLLSNGLYAQQEYFSYENSFDNRPTDSIINLTDSVDNIWQIGVSNKTVFSGNGNISPPSLITDTLNNYPINNVSIVELDLSFKTFDFLYHNFYLQFNTNFQTDIGKDGGSIEISYDAGSTWTNVLEDTLISDYAEFPQFTGLYKKQDTLFDGSYGFSGESSDWETVILSWAWTGSHSGWFDEPGMQLKFRFVFKSDSIVDNFAGWAIDNFWFYYDWYESVKSNENNFISEVFPNPVYSYSIIGFDNIDSEEVKINIYNINGEILKTIIVNNGQAPICKNDFESGLYFYKMQLRDSKRFSTGKFIVY